MPRKSRDFHPCSETSMHHDLELDVRGLNCPLPILRAKKMLATLPSGTVLQILATDPGAPADFEQFCSQTGNALLASENTEGGFTLIIRRK